MAKIVHKRKKMKKSSQNFHPSRPKSGSLNASVHLRELKENSSGNLKGVAFFLLIKIFGREKNQKFKCNPPLSF